ncbi:Rab GTPase [Pelomyxa schiedti]|nr:Rab GTPase [Pelomyxa schiedti]
MGCRHSSSSNSSQVKVGGSGTSSNGSGSGPNLLEVGIKVVLLGHTSAGKTCLVGRLVQGQFVEALPTIGASFQAHRLSVDSRTVKLELWDTAGQERYRSLTPMYYRNARVALIVYDITSPESFSVAKKWVDELKLCAPQNLLLAFVGNKSDLDTQRAVEASEAQKFLHETFPEGLTGGGEPVFFECSAKSGDNVMNLFQEVCRRLITMHDDGILKV